MGKFIRYIKRIICENRLLYAYVMTAYMTIRYDILAEDLILFRYVQERRKGGKPGFIYQISSRYVGVLSLYMDALPEMKRLRKKGLTAVIDYERPGDYKDENPGLHNIWDSVFQQPCGIAVEEMMHHDKVIVKRHLSWQIDQPRILKKYNPGYYKRMNRKFSGVFSVREEIQKKWDIQFSNMFRGKRVLGVSLRETFRIMHEYSTGWSDMHPTEPGLEEAVRMVKIYLKRFRCEYIYLTTEFTDSLELFKHEFKEKLLYTDRLRHRADADYINIVRKTQNDDIADTDEVYDAINEYSERTGGESKRCAAYVEEIYGLSKCTSLIGTRAGGVRTALFWNAGTYEHVSFWEKLQED